MSVQVPPTGLVLEQVYANGGLTGSSYKSDYVVLFNRGTSTVSLTGTSLQYATATGTTWTVVPLSGSIAAGKYFMVKLFTSATGTSSLTSADLTVANDLTNTSGKIALVSDTTALSGACPTSGTILDFLGYGPTANCSETSPTAVLSTTAAAKRGGTGCTDTGSNNADFTVGTPAPIYSAQAALSCAATSWNQVNLTGSIPAGGYYLVGLGSDGGHGAALPTPNVTAPGVRLDPVNGMAALVSDQTALSTACPVGGATVTDFLGYGSSTCFEGSAAVPALSATSAATRKGFGCTDTDQNGADWSVLAPIPANTASSAWACRLNTMTPQEKLLEFMLFDLASCVTPDTPPACVPVTCSSLGLNCGMAGDGCGGTQDCGTCVAPNTCGGAGVAGVCGTPKTYQSGVFTRDYDASTKCVGTQTAQWNIFSWSGVTPGDSRIEFYVQTAFTAAGLATAPVVPLVFSNPPGPLGLLDQPAAAHAVDVPVGAPDTEMGSVDVTHSLLRGGEITGYPFLRITIKLVPTSDKQHAPTLDGWDMHMDCVEFN
jgi:hypothetical protein